MNPNDLYVSLDEARELIKERWNNVELKKRIEEDLGNNFLREFFQQPRCAVSKNIQSPDMGYLFFLQCAHYVNAEPLALEFVRDMFVHFNEEKKGLGRLRVLNEGMSYVDVIDFAGNEKKKIDEIKTFTGEDLVNFHHSLFSLIGSVPNFCDLSDWYSKIGKAKDYYYQYLLHFVAHGILLETFPPDKDDWFTYDVVIPFFEIILKKYGVRPIVCRLYPENQSDKEDFYWWSYPDVVNKYLIEYSLRNNLSINKFKSK